MNYRYRALDGWRGIAALMVALYHFGVYSHVYDFSLVRHSFLFVDFFFVLSGFVVSHAYGETLLRAKPAWVAFVIRRFGRLWPLHIAVLLMFLALELSKLAVNFYAGAGGVDVFSHRYSFVAFVANVFLVHGFGLFEHLTWNFPSWSISAEFWIYISYMMLCLLAVRVSRYIAIALAICIVAVSFVVLYCWSASYINATYDFAMFRCFIGFMVGVLAFRVRNIYQLQSTVIEVATVISCFAFMVLVGNTVGNLLAPFVFGLVVVVFSAEGGLISKILVTKPFLNLGEWSYSVYMVHGGKA